MKNPFVGAFFIALVLHLLFFQIPFQRDDKIESKAATPQTLALRFKTRKNPPKQKVIPKPRQKISNKPMRQKRPTEPKENKKETPKPLKNPLPQKNHPVQTKQEMPKTQEKNHPAQKMAASKKEIAEAPVKSAPVPPSKPKSMLEKKPFAISQPAPLAPPSLKHPSPSEQPPQQKKPRQEVPQPQKEAGLETRPVNAIATAPIAMPSENIRIIQMAQPHYPRAARRQFREGTVNIKVHISATGDLETLTVQQSSGSEDLDEAALEAVQNWEFQAATQNGIPIGQTAVFPIRFSLE